MGTNRSSRCWLLLITLAIVPLGCSTRETRRPSAPVAELALLDLGPKVGKPGSNGTTLAAVKPSPLTGGPLQASTRPDLSLAPNTSVSGETPNQQTLAALKDAKMALPTRPSVRREDTDFHANEGPQASLQVPSTLHAKVPPPPPPTEAGKGLGPASPTYQYLPAAPVEVVPPLSVPSSAPTAALSVPMEPVTPLQTPALTIPTTVAQADPKSPQAASPGAVSHGSKMVPHQSPTVEPGPAGPSLAPVPVPPPNFLGPTPGVPISEITQPAVPADPGTPVVVVPAGPPIVTSPPAGPPSAPVHAAPQVVSPAIPGGVAQPTPQAVPVGSPMAQFGPLGSSTIPGVSTPASMVPSTTTVVFPAVPAGTPANDLRTLHRLAIERHNALDSFIVRLRRREVINGRSRPEELILLKYRKTPWSIYLKWLAGEGVGREVLCSRGRMGERLYVLPGSGDMPLLLGSRYLTLSPDHPLVRSSSRHPISAAGFGHLIEHFGKILEEMERGERRLGTLKYLGLIKRPEYDEPVEAGLEFIAPGIEPDLPRGGQRFWYFDTNLRLPVLIITQDDNRREIEYYCHDRFLFPGRLSDDEFNPELLWRK